MSQNEVRFDFLPKQREFLNSSAKYTAFIGGIGSGKTFAGCVKAYIEGVQKGRPGMIVAPTFPMLRDVTQTTFLELLDSTGVGYAFNKSENKIFVNGATILFRSAEKPDRLRGPNLSWVYLDEAAMMRGKIWEIVIGRLRVGVPKGWLTTTPAGFNWVYNYFVKREDDQYKIFRGRTQDNTYLPDDYINDLVSTYSGEFARQELDGEFTLFEGLVYSEYRSGLHSQAFDIAEGMTLVRAIDYGYTNPFVCLWGALDEDGRLYIYDEHYANRMLIKDHAAEIHKRQGKFSWTVADHDAQDSAEMRNRGIFTIRAKKDVMEGIQRVKARFLVQGDGRPRLFVHPRCQNTIRELLSYRWQDSKDGKNDKEEPVKENDHAMDALRYMVMQIDKPSIKVSGVSAGRLGL